MSARPKVVVLDDYEDSLRKTADWEPVEARADVTVHTERLRGEALMGAIQDADAIVLVRDRTPLPSMLAGERLGVIGFGGIGQKVGQVGQAFEMELVTWSPRMTPERAAEGGAKAVCLEELLSTSASRASMSTTTSRLPRATSWPSSPTSSSRRTSAS